MVEVFNQHNICIHALKHGFEKDPVSCITCLLLELHWIIGCVGQWFADVLLTCHYNDETASLNHTHKLGAPHTTPRLRCSFSAH